jgi:hypothetical protein
VGGAVWIPACAGMTGRTRDTGRVHRVSAKARQRQGPRGAQRSARAKAGSISRCITA